MITALFHLSEGSYADQDSVRGLLSAAPGAGPLGRQAGPLQVRSGCGRPGDDFTLADCAAAPPLFYVNKVFPLEAKHKNAARYLKRLLDRPSYARAIEEAKPYFSMFPI